MKFLRDLWQRAVGRFYGKPAEDVVMQPIVDPVEPENPTKTYTGRRKRLRALIYSAEDLASLNPAVFRMRDGATYRVKSHKNVKGDVICDGFERIDKDRRPVKVRKAARREMRARMAEQPKTMAATA